MILDDEEMAMRAGEAGTVDKTALQHQIKVGTSLLRPTSCR